MDGQKPKEPLNSRFCFRVLPVAAALFIAASALAADPTCKYVADANTKIYTIPVHIFSTETAVYTRNKPRNGELIYLNNKTYVQINGKWRISPTTQQQLLEARKEAEDASANMTCHAERDDSVNGEAATLYSTHQQTPDDKIDSQIWISKSRGVPLKLEVDMDVGGAAGKSHRSMRYEYKNIQAPAVVQ